MGMTMDDEDAQAGFSLIEIVIALGLFSLISLAGVVMVSSILGVRERTEGRLEELGDLQRGLMLITSDFQQASAGSLRVDSTGASLSRPTQSGPISVKYIAQDEQIARVLSAGAAASVPQPLLDQVGAVRWRVLLSSGTWVDAWSGASAGGPQTDEDVWPVALAVELDLSGDRAGITGNLRHVVELAEPQ